MISNDLWLAFTEGAAILLSAGSLWLMIRGRKSGGWPWTVAEAGAPASGSNETLRQLVEESQALCADLLNQVDARQAEKINQLSRMLNRVEEEPAAVPTAINRNRYLEAIDLAGEGFTLSEIGKRLRLTKGEVQLLLDLKSYCLK